MPRQSFLSRESFVDASEKVTRDSVLALPAYVNTIQLLEDKQQIEAYRFCYGPCAKELFYHIDVSILPLNNQYTRVSLHACHVNGHSFYSDPEMSLILHEFESAIHASVKGDMAAFRQLAEPKKQKQTWWQQLSAFLRWQKHGVALKKG